jgi:DNA-binding NarL/FixJ family response regulator
VSITVLIAERPAPRRPSPLDGLRHADDIRVVGEAESGHEVIAVTAALQPRVLLLGSSVARRDVPILLALVRRKSRATRVIVVARRPSWRDLLDALRHGARGYLDEISARRLVSKAVRVVAAGQPWVPRAIVSEIVARVRPAPVAPPTAHGARAAVACTKVQ